MKNPKIEGAKEVLRWVTLFVVSFVVSWFITETLKQVANVPEVFNFKVWVFSYNVPLRELFTFGLTFVGRYVDKYLHEVAKQGKAIYEMPKPSGLLPF